MIRLYDTISKTSTGITFTAEQITSDDNVVYVVYDTECGYEDPTLQDYYTWRVPSVTSTGMTGASIFISNATLWPKYTTAIPNYDVLLDANIKLLSYPEFLVLKMALDRVDLVRKRLPNPGAIINDIDGVGEGNVVSVAGGYWKKFSIEEMLGFIEGALIETNITSPKTSFYWGFTNVTAEKTGNPYNMNMGIPYKFIDVLVQGCVIRAMYAWGLLEVDLNFSTSDAGLQVTYDKVNYVSAWTDKFIAQYEKDKKQVKMDCINSAGVGVGSIPFATSGIYGYAMGQIQHSGVMPLQSMLGYGGRGNIPM